MNKEGDTVIEISLVDEAKTGQKIFKFIDNFGVETRTAYYQVNQPAVLNIAPSPNTGAIDINFIGYDPAAVQEVRPGATFGTWERVPEGERWQDDIPLPEWAQ